MNVLDLFSGIGGFSLGLERAGMRTVAFCEIDPFCRAILAKHWPRVPCYDDIRELTAERLAANSASGDIAIDVIAGGFPCQDLSIAQGKNRAGLAGARSGLWTEYARLIGEIRPRFVIVENVPGLLSLGLDQVLGDLATLGYDAEWHCIQAADVGARHIRDRFWLVGYPDRDGKSAFAEHDEVAGMQELASDAASSRFPQWGWNGSVALATAIASAGQAIERDTWRLTEPPLCRSTDGIPHRLDRVRSLGNAVVPQIPEIIGRAIMTISTLSPPSSHDDT